MTGKEDSKYAEPQILLMFSLKQWNARKFYEALSL